MGDDMIFALVMTVIIGTMVSVFARYYWTEELEGTYFHLRLRSLLKKPEDRYIVDVEVTPNTTGYYKWEWSAMVYAPESAGGLMIARNTGTNNSVANCYSAAKWRMAESIFEYEEKQKMAKAEESQKVFRL